MFTVSSSGSKSFSPRLGMMTFVLGWERPEAAWTWLVQE
jgi:hypothetical protein